VGPWDALVRTGRSGLPQPLPLTLCAEVSGVIEAVGPNVREFAVGEEVFGTTNARFVDGYAEYAMASAKMIARKPSNLSAIEAASMPVVAVTAWQMLFDHAHAQEGHTVFIQGAAGNVGAYALQLALWRKMRVVAGVRDGDIDRIRRLGASEIIDMRTANSEIRGQCADVVIDTVGGSAQHDLFGLLKPGGILVSVVSPPDARLAVQHHVRSDYFIVDVNTAHLAQLARMIETG
jgi:NADPH:quinone reductase-like Zn-dependent oxidoreductase